MEPKDDIQKNKRIDVLCPECKRQVIDLKPEEKQDKFIICKQCSTKMHIIHPTHTVDGKVQVLKFSSSKDDYNIEPRFEEY